MNYVLSVVIPIYNSELFLRETLDSVVNQTVFEKIEVILINDGSTDNSLKICMDYADRYSNIILFNQNNSGVSEARNLGIKKATGKYLTFLDSDDIIEYDLYEKELIEIINGEYDVLIIDFVKKHENGIEKKYRKNFKLTMYKNEEIMKNFFKGVIGGQVVDKVFLTDLVKNKRFSREFKIGEDMLFTFDVLNDCNKACLNTFISGYKYIVRDSSAMTGKFSPKYFDPVLITKKILSSYKKDDSLFSYAYAHYIHESCKVVEYIYRHNAQNEYNDILKKLIKEIKNYSIFEARKFLVKKQFFGFLLMKYSPRIYMFFHKIMHIG